MNSLSKESLDFYQHIPYFSELNNEENAALASVLISLKAYYDSPNPVLDFNFLKLKVIEFDGAAYLKKLRKKAIINHFNGLLYEEPEWYNEYPTIPIKEIGDIFNYQYCFPWEAVDELDYLQSQIPVKKDPEFVDKFIYHLDLLLSQCDTIKIIDPHEILLNLSGSKSLSNNGKKSFHYLDKHKNLEFSSKRSPGSRVFITTAPADGRDAIINKINDLNRIQYIEYQLDYILHYNDVFSHHLVDKDEERFNLKYEKFFNNNRFFLMRDIKKEGITKPKYLLKIMLDRLYKRFPNAQAFDSSSFYDGPWFEEDKGDRGHGLGMANNLTTLMQIVCFRILEELIADEGLDIPIDMICHNDDIVIGVDGSVNDRDDVLNFDIDVLENLGILISRDKSFSSAYGSIICERYMDRLNGLHRKDSYRLRDKLQMFLCENVTHLKSCLSSFYYNYRDEIDIGPLIAKFGYEFSPKEFNLPISCGGWQRLKSYRVSFDLVELKKNYCPEVYRIWLASRHNRIILNRKKPKKFVPPIFMLFPNLREIPEEIEKSFFVEDDRTISNTFYRFKFNPIIRKNAWIRLYEKRQKVFKDTNCVYIDFESLIPTILEDGRNYFPVESMIDRWVDIEIRKGYMEDPYTFLNPVGCALAKLGVYNNEDVLPSFYPLKNREYESIARADTRKSLGLVINYLPPIYIFKEDEVVIPKDENDFVDFFRSYPAPLLLGKVVQMYGKIPILKKSFLIEKDTWGFYLTKDEFLLYNFAPWLIRKNAVLQMRKHSIPLIEMMNFFHSLTQFHKEDTPSHSESDSESEGYLLEELQASLNLVKEEVIIEEAPTEKVDQPKADWEESWELLLTVTNRRDFSSYDSVLFKLDPTMYEIVWKIKTILQHMDLCERITDPEMQQMLAQEIKDFEDEYPEFYNEFLKDLMEESEKSDEDIPEYAQGLEDLFGGGGGNISDTEDNFDVF